jgi:hypothetical protein
MIEQFFLGDDALRVAGQKGQHIKGPCTQRDRFAVKRDASAGVVDLQSGHLRVRFGSLGPSLAAFLRLRQGFHHFMRKGTGRRRCTGLGM